MQEPETDDPILDQDGPIAEAQPEKRARELAIEAIAEGNLRRLEAETGVKLTDESEQSPEDKGQLSAQLSDGVIDDPAGKKVRVKVDGEEREVALADLLRTYQVTTAADQRLQEATRILNEAKARAQDAPEPQQAPAPQAPVQGSEGLQAEIKTALEQLYEGNTDAAAVMFSNVIKAAGGQPVQPAISIDLIHEQLQERLAIDTAFATIQTDYPDVISNSELELLTTIKRNQKMAAGLPQADAMLEASKEVYQLLGKGATAGRQQERQSESRDEKLQRKAGLDRILAANVSAAQADDDVQEANPSVVIQEIANRRMGQQLAYTGRR